MNSKRLCIENINGECRNLAKNDVNSKKFLCPHCLLITGKDSNGNIICKDNMAEQLFKIFEDKLT